jgi:hypothetical protein
MVEQAARFLTAEETAQRLVESLKKLHQEATSYHTSTKELELVRQKLVQLIESIREISKDSHEAIKIIASIGGPEILESLDSLSLSQGDEFSGHKHILGQLKMIILVTLGISFLSLIIGIISFFK